MKPKLRFELGHDKPYVLAEDFIYYSDRYDQFKTIPAGYRSDGATFALDIKNSSAWLIHDHICDLPFWDDGTPIKAYHAAKVLGDCLRSDGYYFRSFYWAWSTLLFGCHKTRKNGWF